MAPALPPAADKIRTDHLPAASGLWQLHRSGDFLDCYSVASTLPPRVAVTQGLRMPGWAAALLALRNTLLRPFGLRTAAPPGQDAIGMFPVCKDDASECILGFDDRHLDFRIAVLRQGDRIYASTWVHPHNIWGRAYLAAVMPFHILILRGAVARMAG